jgi:anti-sigma regulatory factor (Ser/Thr protein kinase)
MAQLASKQFLLPNTRQSIKPSVQEVLDFVINSLPAGINAEGISFKIEVIIIELLTNGIKHAGTIETFLDVTINDVGHRELLTKDGLHSMYAVVESDTQIRFVCEEENGDEVLDVTNLMEHFGLLIITKSSDTFTYEYDVDTGLNTFSVIIDLN